jgi:acetolactate synthase-1/2/3 large subunit
MNGQEIATAARYNTNVMFIVINNSLYGSIQMHQERRFPNRSMACDLTNPEFDKLAQAYGLPARKVTSLDDFKLAYEELDKTSGPCLIEIVTGQDILTPSIKLVDLRKGS